jgi:hypothetical protein
MHEVQEREHWRAIMNTVINMSSEKEDRLVEQVIDS